MTVQTVTGPIALEALGRTLMHEHLVIGFVGWEADTIRPGPTRDEMRAICIDRIQELRAQGIRTVVDPCPNDLGRDVELAAEVAQATGFQIVCATGLYKQAEGGTPYWEFRSHFGSPVEAMTELFVREITEGIGRTGIRAGIIKVATGLERITAYEKHVLEAAARASIETGAPILTHTDAGSLGDEQQAILVGHGVPPQRILVGHSCGTVDHDYHMKIVRGGSYLGFDRFGIEAMMPDAQRVESLLRLIRAGAGDRAVVSHDSIWCWRGEPIPPALIEAFGKQWRPTHFLDHIAPMLRDGGATEAQIEALILDNPRRFFSGKA